MRDVLSYGFMALMSDRVSTKRTMIAQIGMDQQAVMFRVTSQALEVAASLYVALDEVFDRYQTKTVPGVAMMHSKLHGATGFLVGSTRVIGLPDATATLLRSTVEAALIAEWIWAERSLRYPRSLAVLSKEMMPARGPESAGRPDFFRSRVGQDPAVFLRNAASGSGVAVEENDQGFPIRFDGERAPKSINLLAAESRLLLGAQPLGLEGFAAQMYSDLSAATHQESWRRMVLDETGGDIETARALPAATLMTFRLMDVLIGDLGGQPLRNQSRTAAAMRALWATAFPDVPRLQLRYGTT